MPIHRQHVKLSHQQILQSHGPKICLSESYSLGQGTQKPWVSERHVSITSDIYYAQNCHFQLKRQTWLKFHMATKEIGFTSFTCLFKTKNQAKSKEIFKSLPNIWYLAIQFLRLCITLKVILILSHTFNFLIQICLRGIIKKSQSQ